MFGQHTLLQLGCLPNEYLYYYYQTSQATEAIGQQRETRGASIHDQQQSLYPSLLQAPHPYKVWDAARRSREEGYLAEARTHGGEQRDESDLAGGGGYERVALSVMRALSGGGGTAQLILNVPNSPVLHASSTAEVAVPGLPADAVVEVPCEVTPDGALPLPQDRPDGQFLTLMQHVKEVERLTIRAVVAGEREAAVQAFAAHPLVGSAPPWAGSCWKGTRQLFPG